MPHYKTTNDTLYFLDSAEFEHLLPEDCTLISDEEVIEIRGKQEAERLANLPKPNPPSAEELMDQLKVIQDQITTLLNSK